MKRRNRITKRDLFIARGLALGESVNGMAQQLDLKPQTVRRRLSDLYALTDARTQAGLVGWAVAKGLVTIAELQEVHARREADRGRER